MAVTTALGALAAVLAAVHRAVQPLHHGAQAAAQERVHLAATAIDTARTFQHVRGIGYIATCVTA